MTGKKILIADFDTETSKSFSRLLQKNGLRTVTAIDGETALDLVKKENLDLIILEPMLPKLHGFDLCKKITQKLKKKIPILVVSGFYTKNQFKKQDLRILGISAFLRKPYDEKDLFFKVITFLYEESEKKRINNSQDKFVH